MAEKKYCQKLIRPEDTFVITGDHSWGRKLEQARAAGFRKYVMFLHYPPTNILQENSIFTQMAQEYGAEHKE